MRSSVSPCLCVKPFGFKWISSASPRLRVKKNPLRDQLPQFAPADHAAFLLISARALPVGLQADPAAIAIALERRDLAAPIHRAFADRAKSRSMAGHMAILRMHVDNAFR